MKHLTSLPTKLCVVLATLMAFAFNGDDTSFSFYLGSETIFIPGDPGTSIEFSGNNAGKSTIQLRAYRIPNPVEFFLAQKDPHSPTLSALTPPNTFDMVSLAYDKAKRDVRYAARDVMPEESRRAIRDAVDINGVKDTMKSSTRPTTRTTTPSTTTPRRGSSRNTPRTTPSNRGTRPTTPTPEPTTPPSNEPPPKGAEGYPLAASWSHTLGKSGDEGDSWSYESIPVPIKEKGVYMIEGRLRGKRSVTVLIISETGLVIKQSNNQALAFVADRKSGSKIADFPLVFSRGGSPLASKASNSDGVVRVEIPPLPKKEPSGDEDEEDWEYSWRERQLLVVGEHNGNFVISDPYYWGDSDNENFQVYLHTDRPVYRPGQQVFYRGIVRRVNADGTYANETGEPVAIEVTDARDGVVKRDTLKLSDVGTFSGDLTLGDEPPLGSYSIKVTVKGEEQWFNFSVEEYKKPEYKVVVTTDKSTYTRGDEISATVKADYFFGSPVANAQVEYFVYRARYWRPWWKGSEWEYLYEDGDDFYTYRMEMVHSGKGSLQPDGTFKIQYMTDDSASQDYVYRIQANVVDNSRRSISGARSVEVTRGEFYISSHTDRWVYRPGEEARVNVTIATFDGDKPVATDFKASVALNWWEKIKKFRYDTNTYQGRTTIDTITDYEWKQHSEPVWTGSGKTLADGKGTLTYTPSKAGYFEVEISARDSRGTEITESSYIYVSDESYARWDRQGSGDVQIIPDKASYRPGETMTAMIVMPASKLDALVTVEGATLYDYKVQRLNATTAIVNIPIEERYAPVFYLSASALVNDQLYSESQRITVVPQGKLIKLEVKTDKETYRPGETGTVVVRAVDERGNAVANADVAVGMVDEAVYAIEPDATTDIQRFFYGNRWNQVYTSSSLNFSIYGSSVNMAAKGDGLFSQRTGAPDSVSAGRGGRRNVAFGDVKGEMFVQPVVRKNFKDMMFWTPSARTDASGNARLTVTFPDNLTTWRITARGVTANTAVGQTISRVVARKDLLVRMETPRFMTQGDEMLIATTVHNYLKEEKTTKVEFAGTNVTLGENTKTITIPANGEQRIDWKISAPSTGSATLTVKALTDEESDAMELQVPVLPRGMKKSIAESADLDEATNAKSMNLDLPTASDPNSSSMTVSLSPSLAGPILGALDDLIGYPYGCVEQTMSRFLPTVVVADALNKLSVPFDEKRKAQIPKMVDRGLLKLYSMQHDDGGWGWWENDSTDPFMTAYVIYGMTLAERSGFEVEDYRYSSGVRRLRSMLQGGWTKSNAESDAGTTEAYMLYVASLVEQDKPDQAITSRITSLAADAKLNDYGRALLALASLNQGDRAGATRLVEALERSVKASPLEASWHGTEWHYNWQDDEVETSAAVVKALLAVRGDNELVRKGVRWLLAQKEGESWHNTRQTAMVIYSLADYLKSTRELDPDYSVVVKVNGQQVWSGRMTRADVFAPAREINVDRAKLRQGGNDVTVEKAGGGKLYSSARLTYFATGSAIQPQSAGFTVERKYWTLKKEREGDIYVYKKEPFDGTLQTGEELFVKVSVTSGSSYEYFMLEDPLPAGCEVVRNTDGYTIRGEAQYDEKAREGRYYRWYWWYADRDIRDEKIAFFARRIYNRTEEFTYILRAQIPGRYAVMPTVASLMYYPEVRGNTGTTEVRITE